MESPNNSANSDCPIESMEILLRKNSEIGNSSKLFRLCMLGQSGSGKSNIADRFVKNIFSDPHKVTLGVEFQTKRLILENGIRVKFEIWDTSGQERYSTLAPMYYRSANAAVIVYDITAKDSFERAKQWVDELREKAFSDMVIVLVGNKLDIANHRTVDTVDAEVYAEDEFLSFAEVSAKTGVGIQELFENLARRLLNERALNEPPLPAPNLRNELQTPPLPVECKVIKVGIKPDNNRSLDDSIKKGCPC